MRAHAARGMRLYAQDQIRTGRRGWRHAMYMNRHFAMLRRPESLRRRELCSPRWRWRGHAIALAAHYIGAGPNTPTRKRESEDTFTSTRRVLAFIATDRASAYSASLIGEDWASALMPLRKFEASSMDSFPWELFSLPAHGIAVFQGVLDEEGRVVVV